MDSWLDETQQELRAAEVNLNNLREGLVHEHPTERDLAEIWKCYLAVEKAVVYIKVELDEENPGRFVNTKAYIVVDERDALRSAREYLTEGISSIQKGELKPALRALRESRNYLRMLLKRKGQTRKKKTKQIDT
jgi:hypothetical protein